MSEHPSTELSAASSARRKMIRRIRNFALEGLAGVVLAIAYAIRALGYSIAALLNGISVLLRVLLGGISVLLGGIAKHLQEVSKHLYDLNFANLSRFLSVYLYSLFILLALAEGASDILVPVGSILSISLYVLLWLYMSIIMFRWFHKELIAKWSRKQAGEEQEEDKSVLYIPATLASALGIIVAVSQLNRHLFLLFGGFDAHDQTSYWLWLRFGFNQLFDHVLFGIRSIFGWKISQIEPTAIWSRALVLAFNVELDALVIGAVLHTLQEVRAGWHSSGAVPHKNYFDYALTLLGNTFLTCLWALPLVIGIQATIHDQFSLVLAWTMVKRGVPIVSGCGLAWYSLRAFRLPGCWNKLCALGGIMVGVGLIWIFWDALFASLL